MVRPSSPPASQLVAMPSSMTENTDSTTPKVRASFRLTRPAATGRPRVRRIRASVSPSSAMFSAPAAPAPTAMHRMAMAADNQPISPRATTRPVTAVKITSDITRGFSSWKKSSGWAAATGTAPWQAWLLFLIIFLWTPPHSWALALYSAGDYAKAGIPMMPVARGARSTRLQILLYSLVFVPVAIAPGLTGLGGPIYLAVSIAGGVGFLFLAARLWRSRAGDQPDKAEAVGREAAWYDVRIEAKPARNLFAFSILYLMALFAALLVESAAPMMSL